MKIDPSDYPEMRAWFARLVRETLPPELLTPETDPVSCLDRMAAQSPAKARSGLAMVIGDTIEASERWPRDRVEAMDVELRREGLPSLTEMRIRFSKVIRRVANRGSIKNDVEYYAVRNAIELGDTGQPALLQLLSAYEERKTG